MNRLYTTACAAALLALAAAPAMAQTVTGPVSGTLALADNFLLDELRQTHIPPGEAFGSGWFHAVSSSAGFTQIGRGGGLQLVPSKGEFEGVLSQMNVYTGVLPITYTWNAWIRTASGDVSYTWDHDDANTTGYTLRLTTKGWSFTRFNNLVPTTLGGGAPSFPPGIPETVTVTQLQTATGDTFHIAVNGVFLAAPILDPAPIPGGKFGLVAFNQNANNPADALVVAYSMGVTQPAR